MVAKKLMYLQHRGLGREEREHLAKDTAGYLIMDMGHNIARPD